MVVMTSRVVSVASMATTSGTTRGGGARARGVETRDDARDGTGTRRGGKDGRGRVERAGSDGWVWGRYRWTSGSGVDERAWGGRAGRGRRVRVGTRRRRAERREAAEAVMTTVERRVKRRMKTMVFSLEMAGTRERGGGEDEV